jgi:hypothetical protein
LAQALLELGRDRRLSFGATGAQKLNDSLASLAEKLR